PLDGEVCGDGRQVAREQFTQCLAPDGGIDCAGPADQRPVRGRKAFQTSGVRACHYHLVFRKNAPVPCGTSLPRIGVENPLPARRSMGTVAYLRGGIAKQTSGRRRPPARRTRVRKERNVIAAPRVVLVSVLSLVVVTAIQAEDAKKSAKPHNLFGITWQPTHE